jgi:hypothetical protein
MEDNKTRIDMEFVDTEDEQEETKDLTEVKNTEEKPGFFKTVWNGITFVPRWVVRKVKESPASACIGMIGGAALGYGAHAAIGHFTKKGHDDFIPAETPEIEIPDDGEVYSNTNSYGSTDE